ncbi:MAG: TolB family protein [Anaerolineae bacterium]
MPKMINRRFYGLVLVALVLVAAGVLILLLAGLGRRGDSGQERHSAVRVLYLDADEAGQRQIYVLPAQGGTSTPLTDESFGVWDYAVSPDGSRIVSAALRADAYSDLVLIDARGGGRHALTSDPAASSSGAVWLPSAADGRLVYERQPLGAEGLPAGAPELWTLDLASGEASPLLSSGVVYGSDARLSADGQWVAYLSAMDPIVVALNLRDGLLRIVPEATGLPVRWHPQRNVFLTSQTAVLDEGLAMTLALVDPDADTVTPLGPFDWREHGVPAWSPTGEWIALAGVPLEEGISGARQLWRISADGSETQALTEDRRVQYGPPVWSADGRFLLYEKRLRDASATPQGLWLLELETGEERQLVEEGVLPAWAP